MTLDFSRCRSVWVPDESEAGGFWSPPFPHVKEAVAAILEHPYFLLATDMGGAKTASAIIAAHFLHDAGTIDRVIVVAPASVRPKVWFDEDLGQLREQVWEDTYNVVTEFHAKIKRWEHGPKDRPPLRWIVTNYEFIRGAHLDTLLPYCTDKTLLILDESSAVRTYDSAQTQAVMRLRWKTNKRGKPVMGIPRCGRVLMLNGTPIAESPLDMFAQGNILHPEILDCRYITAFKARYAVQAPVLTFGGRPLDNGYGKPVLQVKGWTNLDNLTQRFAPYMLRREAKELGIDFALPPVGLDVALTPATWKAYCAMRDELVVWLKSDVATAATAGVKVMRLAQITSGFLGGVEDSGIDDEPDMFIERDPHAFEKHIARLSVEGDFEAIEDCYINGMPDAPPPRGILRANQPDVVEIGREKLDFALTWQAERLRADPNMKLLTWCRFVEELRRYLREVKKRFNHPVGAACGEEVLGQGKTAEREDALRLLHPKTAPVGPVTVGATQGTGSLGLNFTACRTVLDLSYDFSAFKKKQGDARVNRPGQTGPVTFTYLVATGPRGQKTIDHHVMMVRLGKMQLNDMTTRAWVKVLEDEG